MQVVKKEWPAGNFPYTISSVPIQIKAKGRRIPSWKVDRYGLCGVLPPQNVVMSNTVEDIALIPMGAARLRISAFPVANK